MTAGSGPTTRKTGAMVVDGVPHRTMHGQVVEQLGHRILAGEVLPGDPLPVETDLCARLGVSRGALREAVKTLAAKGLLSVRPRTGTRVRPREYWNFLDADVLRWYERTAPRVLREHLHELRTHTEPGVAELAARRADEQDLARLTEAYERMERAAHQPDYLEFNAADLAFHDALLRAGGNELFISLGRAVQTALEGSFAVTSTVPETLTQYLPDHRAIRDAVAAGDTAAAGAASRRLLHAVACDLAVAHQGGERPR